jgi:cytochrome c oxidase subunit 3
MSLVRYIPAPHLAEHYANIDQQSRAARFGMWIFLATEVLLFGGLFVCYFAYRSLFAHGFQAASHHLDATLGTIETAVLLTSSLFSLHFLRHDRLPLVLGFLLATIAMGLLFLVLHGIEYAHEFGEGILPGAHYRFEELPVQGAILFFTLYFLMTGLHGAHVLVGVGVLTWMTVKAARARLSSVDDTPLEVATLYWHLVDIIWIFLWPMLYLVG